LLERAQEPGAKILISGGGRCNFTNLDVRPENFLSENPHFCKSALSRFDQHDFIAMIERHKIAYQEKTRGQLFCDGSARQVIAMLMEECSSGNVDIRTGVRVRDISHSDARFQIKTDDGIVEAPSLVLASGGLSIPKMGATGFAHDVAKQFGLSLVEPRPGLVPLTASSQELGFKSELMGVSQFAKASFGAAGFEENILFTHRGLSGPAILQISSYWRQGEEITLNLSPGRDAGKFLLDMKKKRPKARPKTILSELLPQRLSEVLVTAYLPKEQMANIPDKTLGELGRRVNCWTVKPTGSEGYAKAEVTCGGIDTRHLSSKTMQVLDVPGLYAIGEAVDVTGWLGGYNFQWAWSSGWCAGQEL